MTNTFRNNAHQAGFRTWQLVLVCSLAILTAGCGKDSDDGDVANTVELPIDNRLNLYCANVGIFTETCVLDDPDNPYARTPFVTADPSDDDVPDDPSAEFNNARGDLLGAAPSPKAKFYVAATALAIQPTGENQWLTALALHELYTATVTASPPGSTLIRDHAIRAYRSVLDNYFDSSTFFEAGFVPAFDPDTGPFYPVPLAPDTAASLAMTPGGFAPLFDANALNNEFFARELMGGWGYTWVGMIEREAPNPPIPGPVFLN